MDPMFNSMPLILQRKIFMRTVFAVVLLVTGTSLLFISNALIALPVLALSILSAMSGLWIYRAYALGQCLALPGVVLKVERSTLLRRPAAILFETDGRILRVMLQDRLHPPQEGGHITLYVLDSTLIQDWNGMKQLSSYLALEDLTSAS